MRRLYLVSYDIRDAKRWRRVYETMKGYGEHVQYSVFLCELTPEYELKMRNALERLIDKNEDQILVVELGPCNERVIENIEAIGIPFHYTPLSRRYFVY